MGRPKKQKQYQIPEQVLNQLNEMIGNGWMLFCNPTLESGFQIYSNFGSEIEFKALRSDIMKWLQAVDMVENQQVLQSIIGHQ